MAVTVHKESRKNYRKFLRLFELPGEDSNLNKQDQKAFAAIRGRRKTPGFLGVLRFFGSDRTSQKPDEAGHCRS